MPIKPTGVLAELLEAYGRAPGDFAFFVGAGLSAPLFPLWGSFLADLLRQARERSGVDLPVAEIEGHLKQGRYFLEIADLLVDALPAGAYRELLQRVFDREFEPGDAPEAYRELMQLPTDVLITTNYDQIPDVLAAGRRVFSNRQSSEALAAFQAGKRFVFKLHGDILDHESIVLTASDYQRIVHREHGPRDVLATVLKSRRTVFLGFSLSDPHIGLVLETIAAVHRGLGPTQYALLPNVTRFEQQAFEKRYGVKVIPYRPSAPSHPEVLDFVRGLGKAARDEAVSLEDAFQTVARDPARYESFDARGIIKVVDTNDERIADYKQCLAQAEGRCFVSGTSMIHLSGDSRGILKEKALGHEVHLLILDPDWIERNWALLTFLRTDAERQEFHREIRASIGKLKSLHEELMEEAGPEAASRLKLRAYGTVFPYIVTGWETSDYGRMVVEVTDYLPGEERPRFTLHPVAGRESLFRHVRDKFYALWDDQRLTTEILP